jgi:CheY-like chemotaxis protein
LIVTLFPEPVWLEADAARLEQILVNLLANAAKYTEPGGRIWLELELQREEAVFRVRDSGIGIAPDVLPIIFNPFTQADKSLDRAQGGLGVGLTLVRRLAEMHQGTIGVSSAGIGLGSEFVLRLPALVEPAADEALNQPEFLAQGDHLRRVLIVEDNVDTAHSMGELLQIWGHEVHLAYDGLKAVETACRFKPEVVLLDIGLPGMDGYQVARKLRQEHSLTPMMIVAISGYGQSEDLLRSHQAGIDHHLVKPVDLKALKALIN